MRKWLLTLLLVLMPVTASAWDEYDFWDGSVHYRFYDESDQIGDPNRYGQGWVTMENTRTGDYAEAYIYIDALEGDVQVWSEYASFEPRWYMYELPDTEYDGIWCHDHPAQNHRFVGLVYHNMIDVLRGAGASIPGYLLKGTPIFPGLLYEIAFGGWAPVLWDMANYAWTCYG